MRILAGILIVLCVATMIVVANLEIWSDDDGMAKLGAAAAIAMFFYGVYLAIAAVVRSEHVVLWIAVPIMAVPGIAALMLAAGGTWATIAKGFATAAG